MKSDLKTLALLQILGLTLSDAKAYAALVGLGSTTPFILAEETGIPRTKIYETIRRLAKDNWLTVERGRPGKVTPLRPRDVIGSRVTALNADFEKMSNEFSMEYEKRMERESPKTTLIRGIENISQKTIEMMGRARTNLYLFGTLYYPEEMESIKQQISAAKRRGVTIRISANNPVQQKDNIVDIPDAFSHVTKDIQIAPEPFVRTLTIDNKEMLMMFPRPESEAADRENLIAIWVSNESVSKAINNAFNIAWGNPKWIGLGKELGSPLGTEGTPEQEIFPCDAGLGNHGSYHEAKAERDQQPACTHQESAEVRLKMT
jgi:HTH-type transcriptional regulator, sugar sensing transcriptional regulator